MKPSLKTEAMVVLLVLFLCSQAFSQSINKDNIENTEKIIGIEFTDAERDSMVDDLNEQLGNYQNIRAIELSNNIPPAILFNPIPAGFDLPKDKKSCKFTDYSYAKMPKNKNDLAFYSIGELAELIRTRQITSIELTRFFLDRLEKYDPILHCVISLTRERAIKHAGLMDEEISEGTYRGLLHGIPFGVKDLLSTKDYKTTWGSVPFKDQIIDEDATVIKNLKKPARYWLPSLQWVNLPGEMFGLAGKLEIHGIQPTVRAALRPDLHLLYLQG